LRVSRGHFATPNCHANYYIDVVAQKTRLSEAKAVAEELRALLEKMARIKSLKYLVVQ
jgi:orotate phosphoribosyltransferase